MANPGRRGQGQFGVFAGGLQVAHRQVGRGEHSVGGAGDRGSAALADRSMASVAVARAARLPVAISAPLGRGVPSEGYPWAWSVFGWLDGENPTVGGIAKPDALARDLAGFITALRRIDPTGGPSAGRGVPLANRDVPTRQAIERLNGIIDTETVPAIWRDAVRLPEWSGPATWSHRDLSPGNVLVSADRLSGVIDFAGVGVGDPTVDLIVAWNLLPAKARRVFRAAMGADEETWLRGRGWALSIALIQLPYYRETNPVLAANSRHVIDEVIADHKQLAGCA